jgi:hypothetical protein
MKKEIAKLTPKAVIKRLQKCKGERGTWETHWQEVADHFLPRKNTILDKKTEGQKRTWQLLDNTGMHAAEMLAGALHGMLTNGDTYWMEYTTGNPALDQQDNIRKFLQKIQRDTHNVLNNSNFQTEVHELYLDEVNFGVSCMYIDEDPRTIVRFSTKFIADYHIRENNRGFVDEVYREWKWNAHQLSEEFGLDNLPEKVKKCHAEAKDDMFTVIHAVYPKTLIDPKFSGQMKYTSQYVLKDTDSEISVGEFQEFPYVTPRWTKAAGEVYGRSPSMTALPEMKVLNKMNETMLIGAQKVVDPPLQLPDDGFIMPIITRPGGLNYRRSSNPDDFIRPIFNDTRIDFGYQAMADIRSRVRDAFYVDQLKLAQDAKYMTATEVLQRTEESMRLLGPMLSRMQVEFLTPLIDRVFRIMLDRGIIRKDEIPVELQGKKLDVRYSSLIAKTQRVNEGQSILRVIQAAAPFFQLDPSVALNFNGHAAVRLLTNTYGAPQEILRDVAEVNQIIQAQQQMQAQQMQMQQQSVDASNALELTRAAKEAQGLNG